MHRMWASAYETAAQPDLLEVVWRLDDDDINGIEQFEEMCEEYPNGVKAYIGPRTGHLAQYHNESLTLADASWEVCSFIGDDVVFETQGWDDRVREEISKFDDRIALVYGDDLINGQKLGTHCFLHRNVVNLLGYVVPPVYTAFFSDTHMNEIMENVNRRIFMPDVIMEHAHPSVQKGSYDITTHEMYARNRQDNNDQKWFDLLPMRMAEANKLAKHIGFEIKEYRRLL